jgi:hypothetical protein
MTATEIGLEVELEMPFVTGSAEARSTNEPRIEGFQVQVVV